MVEVSSFQLEARERFRPKVCPNVTPDHLDRHGTLERYAAIKARLFRRQTEDDYRVQPLTDPLLVRLGDALPPALVRVHRPHRRRGLGAQEALRFRFE